MKKLHRLFGSFALSQLDHAPLSVCDGRFRRLYASRSATVTKDAVRLAEGQHLAFPSLAAMKKRLEAHHILFHTGHTCFHMDCMFCPTKKVKKDAKVKTFFINMTSGEFVCLECGVSGSWTEFEDQLGLPRRSRLITSAGDHLSPAVSRAWNGAVAAASASTDLLHTTLSRLKLPLDSAVSLRRLSIRLSEDGSLLCPMFSVCGEVAAVRSLSADGRERVLPSPAPSLFAGWGTLIAGGEYVTLVSRLVDAIALHHASRAPVLLLPHGSTYLCPKLLPWLERFRSIRLWLPGDAVSWSSIGVFAKKLSEKRCIAVRPSVGLASPADCIKAGVPAAELMSAGSPVLHQAVTTFSTLRDNVKSELVNAKQVAGVQWVRMSALNKILCGHRRGELTVFSGPTGSGKTTFISDFSLDLCMQGVNTLWGSFEINNTRLAKVMLTQFAGYSLEKSMNSFEQVADEFQKLPIWFMTFHGQNKVTNVLDAMSHATYIHDIGHVVLDNLQFMMGAGGFDRFVEQDNVVSKFRQFATSRKCHVTLVIHPRKERDEEELGVCSVFGGARATQEADNVIILQVHKSGETQRKYLQVLKNRFSGDLASIPLRFNKECLSFTVGRSLKTSKTPSTHSCQTANQSPAKPQSVNPNSTRTQLSAGAQAIADRLEELSDSQLTDSSFQEPALPLDFETMNVDECLEKKAELV